MQLIIMKKGSLAAVFILFSLLMACFSGFSEARSGDSGFSFGESQTRAVFKSAPREVFRVLPASAARTADFERSWRSSAKSLAGGLMSGFAASRLVDGVSAGGLGGSGVGLIEILLLAGLMFLLYKFVSKKGRSGATAGGESSFSGPAPDPDPSLPGEPDGPDMDTDDPLAAGIKAVRRADETFDPDRFKEIAQDLFFKVQAGWTGRETRLMAGVVGDLLLEEYDRIFDWMKGKGHVNRLENIDLRRVDLVQAGVEAGEIFVTVCFIADLLDYTVDDRSGELVSGDRENPVKFKENWTFSRPVGTSQWKVAGIDVP